VTIDVVLCNLCSAGHLMWTWHGLMDKSFASITAPVCVRRHQMT